jgi:hypothetical protein
MVADAIDYKFGCLKYYWSFCLGAAGFLDILATLLPPYVKDSIRSPNDYFVELVMDPFTDNDSFPDWFLRWVQWLDKHDTSISFIFSAVWFAHAFFDAQASRNKVLINEERKKFLYKGDQESMKATNWWKTPTFVYYRTIVVQLLLLPVGFYFLLFYQVTRVSHGEQVENLDDVDEEYTWTVTDRDDVQQYETLSAKSNRTVVFAIIEYLFLKVSGTTARVAKAEISNFARLVAWNVLGKAIRNPFKFRKKIRKFLKLVRWAKYLAPLIGTINKLKGNIQDLLKKRRQRQERKVQKLIRKTLWEKKTGKVKEYDAVLMIQSAYRSYYTRKATRALEAFQGDKKYLAVLKVQRVFRRKLREARDRIQKKHEELKRLEKRQSINVNKLSDDEKILMYELQDELRKEVQAIVNRKLLMRPNTKFAVTWKYLFIICVSMEITELAMKPLLDSYQNKKSDTPMTTEEFVATTIVPTRVSDLPQCQPSKKNKKRNLEEDLEEGTPWYCRKPASTVQEGFRDAVALVWIPAPVSEWPECQEKKRKVWDRIRKRDQEDSQRWYCQKPYTSGHSVYRKLVDFFHEELLILVSIVCFLDVFVTFFTGELHLETGNLIPKPFFPRWILPGLVLQLLVNPEMEAVSSWVSYLWREKMVKLGPNRVGRWSRAVVFPVAYYSFHFFIEYVWIPLVHNENTFRNVATHLI